MKALALCLIASTAFADVIVQDAGVVTTIRCSGALACSRSGSVATFTASGNADGGYGFANPLFNDGGSVGCLPAGATDAGCVVLGAQNFPYGTKTFLSDVNLDGGQININWGTSSTSYFPRFLLINPTADGISGGAWVSNAGYATNNLYGSTYGTPAFANWYVWVVSGLSGYKFYFEANERFRINDDGITVTGDTTSPVTAALRLTPQNAEPTGANVVGDIYVTTAGVLKICTVAGTPGTWVSVGAQ